MDGSYDFRFGQLPDMQFMQGKDAFNFKDRSSDFFDRDRGRYALKKYERSTANYE
jgi:hypothetical protein